MPRKMKSCIIFIAVLMLILLTNAAAFAAPAEGIAEEALLHQRAIITLVVLPLRGIAGSGFRTDSVESDFVL